MLCSSERSGIHSTALIPSLQVTDAISSHEGAENVFFFQGPDSIPYPYTKTREIFCIDVPLGNTSVDLKQLLNMLVQFYG